MRDLEQILERGSDDGGRRIGAVLLATLVIVGLTFALGVVAGRAAEPPAAAHDPLDRLSSTSPQPTSAKGDSSDGIERGELTFPQTLSDEEERPEVLAALRAAAEEEARLAETDPSGGGEEAPEGAAKSLPAGVSAGAVRRNMANSAQADPLMAVAPRSDRSDPETPGGEAGEYTLQVLSYDTAEAARDFARDLRTRGHGAFVVNADLDGRGRSWRVRIGPFDSMRSAQAYRDAFERSEGMNTFVVRRSPDE